MMSLESEVKSKLKKVLVIDDSYAPAEVGDIDDDAVSRFTNALVDEGRRVTQVKNLLGLSALDPSIPKHVHAICQEPESVAKLWSVREKAPWKWLSDTLFQEYLDGTEIRNSELEGLESLLGRFRWDVDRRHKFDVTEADIQSAQLIFLDFFLKDETSPEESLARAVALGHLIAAARVNGRLREYPIVVLMSSREGAAENKDTFKTQTGLRADFFCFLKKSEVATAFDAKFTGFLAHYAEKQQLAHLLDEYWLAAARAVDGLRKDLAMVEPTELALLHEAELAVEEAGLTDYMSWLVSESMSGKLLGDGILRARRESLPAMIERCALPGSVPPSSRIADMFVRSMMRLDIADSIESTKRQKVALGDLFGRFDSEGALDELYLVVDQSCDLARPASVSKTSVLCLQCKPILLGDVAMAFYRTLSHDRKGDLIPIEGDGKTSYYLANWDLINPTTPKLTSLSKRSGKLRRIGRYKSTMALARQEQLTQQVGRIGEPVVPPNANAYKAKLFLRLKDGTHRELDAGKEQWASVVIVQGRHDLAEVQSAQAESSKTAVKTGAGSRKVKPKRRRDSRPTSRISFTVDYCEWLRKALPGLTLSEAQASSQRDLLLKRVDDGGVQRVEMKPTESTPSHRNADATVWKAQMHQINLFVAFGKSLPEAAKAQSAVLLLTPYGNAAGKSAG